MTFIRLFASMVLLLPLAACIGSSGGAGPSVLKRPAAEEAAAEPEIDFGRSKPEVQRYMRLGVDAEGKGNADVALMMYRAAAEADRGDPVPLLAVAKLQEASGDLLAAAQLYEAAAQKRPKDIELQLAAARNLLKQRDYARAAKRYETLTGEEGIARDDWRAWNGLGVARGLLGDDAGARAAYSRAMDRAPDGAKTKVRANLALSQVLAGDSRATITLLEPYQANGTATAAETRLLALAYGFVGRVEDAQRLGLSEPPSPDILRQLRDQPDAPPVSAAPRGTVERAVAGDAPPAAH